MSSNPRNKTNADLEAEAVRAGWRTAVGWIWIAVLVLGFGCGSLARRNDGGPGVSKSDYERSCGGCHEAYKPKLKTDEEWQEFVMKHRFLSGHDEETAQLFADYLKRNN